MQQLDAATWRTASAEETEQVGERLAERLEPGDVVAFLGGLGAGKTAFTRGLARGLGIRERVTSPTYTIVNEYRGRRKVCHFDMYRIDSEEGLWEIGWEDYLSSGCLCVVEWSENIVDALPPETLKVTVETVDADTLRITVGDLC